MQYRTKRKFSDEFKREAVKLSVSSPKTLVELSAELGVRPNILSRWRREWIMDKSAADKPVKNEGPDKSLRQLEQENKRLKKKLERAELELDILKKLEEYATKTRR